MNPNAVALLTPNPTPHLSPVSKPSFVPLPLRRNGPLSLSLSLSLSHLCLLLSRAESSSLVFRPSPSAHLFSGTPSPSAHLFSVNGIKTTVPKCVSTNEVKVDPFETHHTGEDKFPPTQEVNRSEIDVLRMLKRSNSIIPHIVLASTVLALVYPPSFSWFTTRFYAPALGFLMFAVGVNSSPKDFVEAIKRPEAIAAGYVGQFIIKPMLGYLFGTITVSAFNLPAPLGAGIMLVSCVSGAQLSNYATFLTDPLMAPLSIVMTSLSTGTAVLVTPTLSLLLIGKKLPVDVKGMMSSIMQIVVAPIAAGLLLNRFLPRVCAAIQPFLPPLSVFVTALCVGSPLAINIKAILSPFGVTIVLLIFGFHATAFIAGYYLPGFLFHKEVDVKALQRTISFETGMQSSLLALALANKFFQDPLVGVPPAISVVLMSLMGFSLVMIWSKKQQKDIQ